MEGEAQTTKTAIFFWYSVSAAGVAIVRERHLLYKKHTHGSNKNNNNSDQQEERKEKKEKKTSRKERKKKRKSREKAKKKRGNAN